jgi:hypothetical protein
VQWGTLEIQVPKAKKVEGVHLVLMANRGKRELVEEKAKMVLQAKRVFVARQEPTVNKEKEVQQEFRDSVVL